MVIVYEPPEESRVQRKLRKKTIFNSVYVQWKHQKGLRFQHKELKLHIEYFFHDISMPWEDCGQEVSRKDFVLFLGYHELLDNHVYSFSWLDPCTKLWHFIQFSTIVASQHNYENCGILWHTISLSYNCRNLDIYFDSSKRSETIRCQTFINSLHGILN